MDGKDVLRDIVGGKILMSDFVTRNVPYLFFILFLLILTIWNRNDANSKFRKKQHLISEIKDLRAEYVDVNSKLMLEGTHSQILEKVQKKGLGLEESSMPPYKITVEKITNE